MSCGMFPVNNTLTLDQKKEILQKAVQNGGWRQVKQDIIKYNETREQYVSDMEKQRDPRFRRYVKMYKSKLGAAEFLKNRLQIYAICNQRVMQDCLSVDEMMLEFINGQPQAEVAIASDENAGHEDSH